MLSMDKVRIIRHKVLVEHVPISQVAREFKTSRNTVKRYLQLSEPRRIEKEPRPRPVYEKVQGRLAALLEESSQWTAGKQRLTATRLHQILLAEGFKVGFTLVKDAIHEWKRQRQEVYIPLLYSPGELAEVDFFEVVVLLAGVLTKVYLFLMRLMCSGRDFACLYPRQDQVVFLDGHVQAFSYLGGIPQRIAYDNLKAAVAKMCLGHRRQLCPRFQALSSHYLFEPNFCRPATGHDKGGVEARGKGIRLQHLVPLPAGDSLTEINQQLLARLEHQFFNRSSPTGPSPAEKWALEQAQLVKLPQSPFRAVKTEFHTASRQALIRVEKACYSVPSRWHSLELTVEIGTETLEVLGPDGRVQHPRLHPGERSIDYRFYLEELSHKPQAVRQVLPALLPTLGEPYQRAWRQLVDEETPLPAARHFAQILSYSEKEGLESTGKWLQEALEKGQPILQALAEKAAQKAALAQESIPKRLREIDVESGCAADYDILLGTGDK
jgi:transposase